MTDETSESDLSWFFKHITEYHTDPVNAQVKIDPLPCCINLGEKVF